VYTDGLTDPQDNTFLSELVHKVSPAYAIFETAGTGPVPAGRVVDVLVAEKLRVPAHFADQAALPEPAWAAWGASLEGAKPYRNSMQLIADAFPAWWSVADEAGQKALARHLPLLAPAVADLGKEGVGDLLAAGEPALQAAAAYSLADTKSVQAILAVARAGKADPQRCGQVLNALCEQFPISMIEDSREAERLLPALGKAVAVAGDGWAEVVELATALLANDASSAYGVMEDLPKALAAAANKQAYAAQFVALVRAMGNRVAGVALKRLAAAGTSPVAGEAVTLAGRFGVLAAERYLESKL
jgi:hypothetical protein